MLSFAGDAIVALLLIATIGYSMVLNRRLGAVRNDREKFEVLVRSLNAASQRAEAAVTNLRVTADDLSRRLEKKVEQARSLSDDLTYMIERGDGIADKLANQVRAGRDALKPDFQPEAKPAAKPQPRAEHVVEPVAPAAAALQAEALLRQAQDRRTPAEPVQRQPQAAATPRPAFVRQEPIRVEPRVAVAAATAALAASAADPVGERANTPSRAERDLLRALAARRR
jgi:ABC-type transporter Mla subunit MlaD